MPDGRSRRGASLLLFVLSVLLALVGFELLLMGLAPSDWRESRYFNHCNILHWNKTYVRFDPDLGHWHKSNLEAPFENLEYQTTIRTNSEGFRDDEESLNAPDILLLGDSFAFGWGVEEHETCAAVLENLSGRKALNMGSGGFGTIQQATLLQRYCDENKVADAEVVLLYYLNDRHENFQIPHGVWPTVRKESTRLVFVPAKEEAFEKQVRVFAPSWKTWGSRWSGVLDLTIGAFFDTRTSLAFLGLHQTADEVQWNEGEGIPIHTFEVLEYMLRVLRLYAEERQMEFSIVFVPFLEQYEGGGSELDYGTEKRILELLEIPFLDPADRFDREDFYPLDRHLNARGQEKLGRALAELLMNRSDEGALASVD